MVHFGRRMQSMASGGSSCGAEHWTRTFFFFHIYSSLALGGGKCGNDITLNDGAREMPCVHGWDTLDMRFNSDIFALKKKKKKKKFSNVTCCNLR
jgi:hypothetical protein